MSNLKDAGHLFRMAAVFAVGIVLFLVVRGIFVPRTFGQYGHYRGAALAEVADRPVMFAGHQSCESCHTDVHDLKSKGVHARVACECCHGPLPSMRMIRPHFSHRTSMSRCLCVRCHEANIAKPKTFPQVVSADHSGGVACDTCHKPHSPKIDTGAAQLT
jgi:hypothetical protein